MVLTELDGRRWPRGSTLWLTVVVATSRSPPNELRMRSVDVSAMPGRTTVVPKSENKPSAAGPQRCPGLGEVLQAGQHQQSLAGPLADHGRQVGKRGDVGDLVEGEQGRAAVRGRRDPRA